MLGAIPPIMCLCVWCLIKHKEDHAVYVYVWTFLHVPEQPNVSPSTGCDSFPVVFGKPTEDHCGINTQMYQLTLPLSRFLSGKKCDQEGSLCIFSVLKIGSCLFPHVCLNLCLYRVCRVFENVDICVAKLFRRPKLARWKIIMRFHKRGSS